MSCHHVTGVLCIVHGYTIYLCMFVARAYSIWHMSSSCSDSHTKHIYLMHTYQVENIELVKLIKNGVSRNSHINPCRHRSFALLPRAPSPATFPYSTTFLSF